MRYKQIFSHFFVKMAAYHVTTNSNKQSNKTLHQQTKWHIHQPLQSSTSWVHSYYKPWEQIETTQIEEANKYANNNKTFI